MQFQYGKNILNINKHVLKTIEIHHDTGFCLQNFMLESLQTIPNLADYGENFPILWAIGATCIIMQLIKVGKVVKYMSCI